MLRDNGNGKTLYVKGLIFFEYFFKINFCIQNFASKFWDLYCSGFSIFFIINVIIELSLITWLKRDKIVL